MKRARRLRLLSQKVGRTRASALLTGKSCDWSRAGSAPRPSPLLLFSFRFSLAVTHTAQPAARHRTPLPRLSWNLRLILGITLLLFGLGSLSCQVQNSVGQGPVMTRP